MVTFSSISIVSLFMISMCLFLKFNKGPSKFLDVCDQSAVFVAQVS